MTSPLLRFCVCITFLAVASVVGAVPSNDMCENAIRLEASTQVVEGSTVDATVDALNLCGENLVTSPGVWYLYQTSAENTIVQGSTCTSQTNFDTALTVYEGFCSALKCVAGRDDDLECDAGTQEHSTISWLAAADQRYYLLIHGSEANHTGNFGLLVSETEPLDQATSSTELVLSQSLNLVPVLSSIMILALL